MRIKPNTGIMIRVNNKEIPIHILIAEKILGKSLPDKVVIHHPNGNQDNSIFVICQDQKYHRLLHRRTNAFYASGHANWRKCKFCKTYDDPTNLYIYKNGEYISGSNIYHEKCRKEYRNRKNQTLSPKEVLNGSSISEPAGPAPGEEKEI